MSEWNHISDVPVKVSPLWAWPPRPYATFRWYFDSWFFFTVNGAIVGLAFLSLWLFSPSVEQAATLAPGWVAMIWVRNFMIVSVLAGGLHYWFHGKKVQGKDLKYDPRPFPRKGGMFTLSDQLLDNMVWTLGSGVTVWTVYEVLIWWAMANGYATITTFAATPVWFVAIFLLIPIWESFYFYWIHRLLHTDLFYRFHALHHRNTDVGPWSGLSMHPVEHVFYFGSVLIHFVIPSHPVHVITHLMFYGLYAITTHTGFEGLLFRNKLRLKLGTFHHQMHHRYFECNYGTPDVPWDILFGSWHDGTDAGKAAMKQRLRERKR
ncbi:MAG: sterol desaturase family protein [Pseudomonadota bacterium]